VMGATYNQGTNSYALGLWLLVITAALALGLALALRGRREPALAQTH
ncbi:MAG: MFS transporter, partial [Propionibacteriaceae bacterium]|nr:MFS transporter [Propionibacteriaceae bacterium]